MEVRLEINEIEKKTIEKINETKSWFFEKDQQNQQNFSQVNREKRFNLLKSEIKMRTLLPILQI